MLTNLLRLITIAYFLSHTTTALAAPGPNAMPPQPPATTVSTSNQQVVRAANYAVRQLNRGSLVQIVSAKQQGIGDINYFLRIELLDQSGSHHMYDVEVCIPQANIPWRLKSVTAVNE